MNDMNRRKFLFGLGAIVGGIAIEQAIPFNRVWSFPSEVKPVVKELYFHRDAFKLATNGLFVPGDIVQFAPTLDEETGLYIVTEVSGGDIKVATALGQIGRTMGIDIEEETNVLSHTS